MSTSIMHFHCNDNALLLQKFELEDFSKDHIETDGSACRNLLRGARECFFANSTGWWRKKTFFEINILSAKLEDMRVTVTKRMDESHV